MTAGVAQQTTPRAARLPRVRRAVRRNPVLVVATAALGLIVLIVVVLPFFLPDPNATDPVNRLLPPSAGHPFGTDLYGRDVLSRLVSGGRASLGLAALITLCAATAGMLIGLISGFFRAADVVLMRIMDAWMAFPAIILATALAVALGASLWTELIALSVIFTPFVARVIRSRVLSVANRSFIDAARVSGMGRWKTLFVHVFPNVLPLALVQIIILSAAAMLIDGALSFLGLGIAPPTPTWGNMIAEGRAYMHEAAWLIIIPGLAIILCVYVLNLIGGSLRQVVDPRSRTLTELQRLRSRGRPGSRKGPARTGDTDDGHRSQPERPADAADTSHERTVSP
ncbi:ABC transporter permease [Actinobacteria bacterium YIM 96077]|uniref:ABC transporter permease n=1 Tax=Phytoactinopolyspora halophila TaxID=1981511 RepID=A0A329QJX4_9ACTN|nr:ABC transporter permease [Phytoactinopolyspora halophila]AYY12523.1 ABC transporter permease [Actinobacteria bacterium YIM 96077]RAW12573.1 ABC transporter permease [Phytoactinopolyspora halophila]